MKWLDKGVALLKEKQQPKKLKSKNVRANLLHDIQFTKDRIQETLYDLNELKKDLITYRKLLDVAKDKEFKNDKELAIYLLSLDSDIMKDYERVYGEDR